LLLIFSDQYRLVGFYIEIDGQECYRWPNTTNPPTVFNVTCDKHGQFVVFKLPYRDDDNVLTLCEIEVFGMLFFYYFFLIFNTNKYHKVCFYLTTPLEHIGCFNHWLLDVKFMVILTFYIYNILYIQWNLPKPILE
jgi:hypothetical protein